MDSLDAPPNYAPPPPPPKKLSRPKITLQIPAANTPTTPRGAPTAASVYWGSHKYRGRPPTSPASHASDPHQNPYLSPFMYNMYHNKASEFMFKQFEGFKDFTMETAKSGLSAGERSAFWFVNKLKLLSKKWFTHLFLTMCLVLYSLVGGTVFLTLEGTNEKQEQSRYNYSLSEVRREVATRLHDIIISERANLNTESFDLLSQIEANLELYEANYTDYINNVKNKKTWTFWNAVFYAGTIYTTIGYGHISPSTTSGRAATIVYAVIGIPLFLIVLADFGKLFTRIIKFFWSFIRRFYYTRSCKKVRRTVPVQEVMKGLNIAFDVVRRPSQIFSEDDVESQAGDLPPPVERRPSEIPPPLPPKPGTLPREDIEPETPAPSVFEIDDEFNLPISVAIVILIIYILIGAAIYSIWEDWSFFESFYFVFISMSTIGLGDLVPDHPHRMMASILYLVFGLALTSMCINVVQVKLSDTFKQASAKLGATIGLAVAEEDGSLVPIAPTPTEIVPIHKPKAEKESKDEDKSLNDSKSKEDAKSKEIKENESDNNKNR